MTLSRMLSLTSFLLSACCAAQAASTPFTGLSLMAGMGGVAAEAKTSQNGQSEVFSNQFDFNYDNRKTVFQGNVATMLGIAYAYQFKQGLVLGAAITAGYNDVTFSSTVSSKGGETPNEIITQDGQLKTQLKNDFAALFKPGYAFGQTLVYGLVGPRWGYIDSSFDSLFTIAGAGRLEYLEDTDQRASYHLGFTAGAGISHAFLKHLIAGIEYQYTAYNGDLGSFNTMGSFPETDHVSGAFTSQAKVDRISTNTLIATVAYQF